MVDSVWGASTVNGAEKAIGRPEAPEVAGVTLAGLETYRAAMVNLGVVVSK